MGLSLKPAWFIYQVPGQPEMRTETLSQNKTVQNRVINFEVSKGGAVNSMAMCPQRGRQECLYLAPARARLVWVTPLGVPLVPLFYGFLVEQSGFDGTRI